MTNDRKGRGSGRSSIAPPFRLHRSVPPSDVVRTSSEPPEAVPEASNEIDDGNRLSKSGSDEQESERIDGSIQKSIEDHVLSSPTPSRPGASLDGRTVEKAERWDEPGSRAAEETQSSDEDHRLEDEANGTPRVETDTTATQSQPPERAVNDSTAADFFSRSSEDSVSAPSHEQPTDTWEPDYDAISASLGSKRASYIIYTVLGAVLLLLGGFYLYGNPDERSTPISASRVRSEDATPTASQSVERVVQKSPEASSNNLDKSLKAKQTDPNPNRVEAESVAAEGEIEANDTPTAKDDQSPSQIGVIPIQPPNTIDNECCASIAQYQEALRLNPNDTEILAKLAYFYLNKGMNPEARRFAERTVDIDPENSTGWIVLGAVFDAMNDHEAALAAYRTCSEQSIGKYVTECRNLIRK